MNKALSFLLYLIVVLERRMLFGEVKNLFHNRSSTSFATLASHFGTSLACSAQALDQSFLDRELYLYHLDCPASILIGERDLPLRTTFRGFFPNNHCGIHCRRDSERTWALPSVNRMDRSPMNIPPQLI